MKPAKVKPVFKDYFSIYILLIVLYGFLSCSHEVNENRLKTYIHISHTKAEKNPDLAASITDIDFSHFDIRMLGGDMAAHTSWDLLTLEAVDAKFDLGNLNTLWSLGNHDYPNLLLIQDFTCRPEFYNYYCDDVNFVVLDTYADSNIIKGEQLNMLINVIDTISSSHLIVLHHYLVWMVGHPELEPIAPSISNGPLGDCIYCLKEENNFYSDVYPELLRAKAKGVNVICIGGDIGWRTNQFSYETEEGIAFLASGIKNGADDNVALVLQNNLKTDSLTWKFEPLSTFIDSVANFELQYSDSIQMKQKL